jgi:hypothetical protein
MDTGLRNGNQNTWRQAMLPFEESAEHFGKDNEFFLSVEMGSQMDYDLRRWNSLLVRDG